MEEEWSDRCLRFYVFSGKVPLLDRETWTGFGVSVGDSHPRIYRTVFIKDVYICLSVKRERNKSVWPHTTCVR